MEKGEDVHFKLKETLTAVDYAVSTDMFRLDDAGLVVIPALSNRDLVHISDGSDTGEIPSAVVKALLTRKEIVILEEGIEYKKNMPKQLIRHFIRCWRAGLKPFSLLVSK